MWQSLLGIYIIVGVLSGLLLWSSLVLAKRSDSKTGKRSQQKSDSVIYGESNRRISEVLELPTLSRISEK